MSLADDVLRLKRERNAVVLAHNYQVGEVQDVADYVGDSLGLSQQAAATEADVIVFCGVHFMAETAAVLAPGKKVLIPDLEAGCSLADSITAEQLRDWKADHPDAAVVSYVNTTAEVKAESDYCCTSANAVAVVQSIPEDQEVLFLPDMFLGNHVKKLTGRKNLSVWWGECHVHAAVRPWLITPSFGIRERSRIWVPSPPRSDPRPHLRMAEPKCSPERGGESTATWPGTAA